MRHLPNSSEKYILLNNLYNLCRVYLYQVQFQKGYYRKIIYIIIYCKWLRVWQSLTSVLGNNYSGIWREKLGACTCLGGQKNVTHQIITASPSPIQFAIKWVTQIDTWAVPRQFYSMMRTPRRHICQMGDPNRYPGSTSAVHPMDENCPATLAVAKADSISVSFPCAVSWQFCSHFPKPIIGDPLDTLNS